MRLAETARVAVRFTLDGKSMQGLAGDTVLTAVLTSHPDLRPDDFGLGTRAGFCLMGACQDCWIWQESGPRLRACSTPLQDGMRLASRPPAAWPEAGP